MKRFLPLFLLLAACGKAPVPTPRQHAFPRVNLYGEEYHTEEVMGRPIHVNDSAIFMLGEQPGWFNICYPAYGVTVQATLTLATGPQLHDVLANRAERMARNVASATAEISQAPGVTLIVAPTALRTPVQILATDSLSWVLSAVAVSNWPAATNPDSVAPILPAIATDLLRLP